MTHGRAWTKCAAEVPITPALALHVIKVSIIFGAVRASYLVDDLAVEIHSRSSSSASSSYVLLSEGFEAAARPPKPLAYGAHLEARMCMRACVHVLTTVPGVPHRCASRGAHV